MLYLSGTNALTKSKLVKFQKPLHTYVALEVWEPLTDLTGNPTGLLITFTYLLIK